MQSAGALLHLLETMPFQAVAAIRVKDVLHVFVSSNTCLNAPICELVEAVVTSEKEQQALHTQACIAFNVSA